MYITLLIPVGYVPTAEAARDGLLCCPDDKFAKGWLGKVGVGGGWWGEAVCPWVHQVCELVPSSLAEVPPLHWFGRYWFDWVVWGNQWWPVLGPRKGIQDGAMGWGTIEIYYCITHDMALQTPHKQPAKYPYRDYLCERAERARKMLYFYIPSPLFLSLFLLVLHIFCRYNYDIHPWNIGGAWGGDNTGHPPPQILGDISPPNIGGYISTRDRHPR